MLSYAATGSWSMVASPNSSAQDNLFNAVTCVSASDCWSVGWYLKGTNEKTLIQRWDGNSWSTVNSPNGASFGYNVLHGVTCGSPSDCWAVGYQQSTSAPAAQTLIQHWDGIAWSIVPSPNTNANLHNYLQSVTCTSANSCWAVGYTWAPATVYRTLTEHWDGSSWSIVASPNTSGTQNNILTSVTCNSAADCWAVGYYNAGNVGFLTLAQTLIQHWNGSAWSIVTSPNTLAAEENLLTNVTCTSASNCWAVGYRYFNTLTGLIYQTLTERWDGTSWSIVPSANSSPTQQNFLFGVTCASPSDCWGVGYYLNSVYQTLIEHWDGATWSIVASPNTSASQTNVLRAVKCTAPWDCWAVGAAAPNGGANQTLTQHYVAPAPPPVQLTAVGSRKSHDTAGLFDVDLPLDGSGIECRSGGASGDYTLVFAFASTLSSVGGASVSSGTGSVSSSAIGSDTNEYIVNLTGVTNAQYLTVTLASVTDSAGNFSSTISGTMGMLTGDVNASGVVTSGDTNLCKAQALQQVTEDNFRNDINASGSITTGDVNLIKQNALTQLPSTP